MALTFDHVARKLEPARRSSMRRLVRLLIVSLMCIRAVAAQGQPESDPSKYQEVFYASGNLRIQAHLYKPDGEGPFFRGDLQPRHARRTRTHAVAIPACRQNADSSRLCRIGSRAPWLRKIRRRDLV